MKKFRTAASLAAFSIGLIATSALAVQVAAPATTNDLKAEKLKSIVRRDPRAQDLIPKVEARAGKLKSNQATEQQGIALERELLQIQMYGAGESEPRLKEDIEFLQAAALEVPPLSSGDLATLQARYAKLVDQLDDNILVKDYDRLLKRHDKFVRYTSYGLWDKARIESELAKMEEMAEGAQDIAFGKQETLRGLQDRRLASVPKLVYFGSAPHEEMFLSPDRRSIGVLVEGLGGQVPMEFAELVVQNPDGQLIDLTTANNRALGIPFSPPLSLWMKTRMAEGRVPAITFKLPSPSKTSSAIPSLVVQDVLDGKLDDYFKKNLGTISGAKQAAIVGLFDDFDGPLSSNSFGKDGRTPYYMLDPKLSKLDPETARAEHLKRAEKGFYSTPKAVIPDLTNQYGDANIADGPERIRDSWKRIRNLVGTTGPNIAFYSTASPFHGNKNAFKFPDTAEAGIQTWNKLDQYWPGENVIDWIGIRAVGTDPVVDAKGPNLSEAIDPFFFEVRSSNWQNTPVMLRSAAPSATKEPGSEAAWIGSLFQKMIPGTYPNTGIVFVDVPTNLTLWSRDASAAFRTNVSSNKFYQWPLRFKMLNEAPPQ